METKRKIYLCPTVETLCFSSVIMTASLDSFSDDIYSDLNQNDIGGDA